MRKLMWFTVGFTAACVAVAYLPILHNFLLWGMALLVVGGGCCFLKKKSARVIGVILLGIGASFLWNHGFNRLYLDAARSVDGDTVRLEVEISDYSRATDYGTAADGAVILEGHRFPACVYLNDEVQLQPGDRVTGDFRLRLTAAGGKEAATYHQGKGMFLIAYGQKNTEVIAGESIPLRYYPAKLRQDILHILDRSFPADTAGFAKALLLGDSTGLTYEEDSAFKVSGIRHVIAVSGLHVSILFALVYMLCGKRRVMTALLGIPTLLLFAAVAGFTPSILRACGMQCLMILAMLFKREYDPPTALSFSVIVMLLWNPLTVTSVSFQLSVGCMVGIFLFCQKLNDHILKLLRCPKGKSLRSTLIRWIAGSVSVTLSAMAVTTPFSAIYFGTVSIGGIVTNLLALWVISFIFYGIMLICVLGAVWLPLGTVAAWLVSWPIRYVLLVAGWIARIPVAAVYTCSSYIVIWLILCYALFIWMLLGRGKRLWLTASCIVVALAVSVFAAWLEPKLDSFRVTVMDVGQGQCILLQSDGRHYLVDCGGDDPKIAADTAAAQLLSQGVSRLDGIILTHYDADHAAGVPYLLSRVKADKLYLPDIPDDTDIKNRLAKDHAEAVEWVRNKTELTGNWGKLTLMPGKIRQDENESSLCILFQAEECDILITGDRNAVGERMLLQQYALPELELLIAGHHGAGTATGFELLSVTRPGVVAISVGKDNYYGHPTPELLERLTDFGCSIVRTDRDGTIIFRR